VASSLTLALMEDVMAIAAKLCLKEALLGVEHLFHPDGTTKFTVTLEVMRKVWQSHIGCRNSYRLGKNF